MSKQKRLATGILIAGLGLTIIAGWLATHYYARIQEQQANLRTDNATYAVRVALDRVSIAVQAVRALYASDWITPEQFERFSRALTASETIRSLSFFRRVDQNERVQYERRFGDPTAGALGIWQPGPDGKPVRAPVKDSYFVVEASYLSGGETPNYGLDVSSLPGRIDAIQDAIRRFELTASDPVRFVGSVDDGVFLYAPAIDRSGSVVGVAAGSITLTELARVAERASGVDQIDVAAGAVVNPSSGGSDAPALSSNQRTFEFGQRRWIVTVTPPNGANGLSWWTLLLIAGTGLAATAAIIGYVVAREQTREIARARASLRGMLDGLGPLAWLLTPDGPIVNAHRAAIGTFGPAKNNGVGKPFWQLPLAGVSPEQTDRLRRAVASAAQNENVRFDLPVERENTRTVLDLWIRPLKSSHGDPHNLVASAVDVTDRYESEETQKLLMRELDHRMKNTLQVIQAIIRRTAKSHSTVDGFEQSLIGRVNAMSRAHELLAEERWHGADLSTVVRQEAGSFDMGGSIKVEGPSVRLSPKAALSFALAVHELGTNASKYGALSSTQGNVRVTWDIDRTGDEPRLDLRWQEFDGPEVRPPTAKGFGSLLLERSIAYELQGDAEVQYLKEGVLCTISAPLRTIRPFVDGQHRPPDTP